MILLQGCSTSSEISDGDFVNASENQISVSGTRFVDSYGRQVIFSGINKVNKNPEMNYTDKDSAGTYRQLSSWGFNCIRLGIIWDGVEPQPGKYDEKYLDKLEARVKWAADNGLYVMLDMHQDLFSVLFSDGAPEWATLTDNKPHSTGMIWSDSYFMSEAVQKAFDNFWANTPVSDGLGVQDHYANMWKHVAKRFAGYKSVLGYDIMNEPFNGSQGNMILPVILNEYAEMYAEETGKILSEQEVMEIWSNEDMRFEALSKLQDAKKYARVLDAATLMSQEFEKTSLKAMYQKVANAIREVDTTHILFLEHAYFSNTGIYSAISPVLKPNGEKDPLVAYAAHGYDLLVDTKNYDKQSNERVELIFSRIDEVSKRENMPVIIGEWGAFHGNSETFADLTRFITGIFEKLHFGNTYWAFYEGIEKEPFFSKSLVRPYPLFTGGKLIHYSNNNETGVFKCEWEESPEVKGATIIYIPDLETLIKESIKPDPEEGRTVIQSISNSPAGYLIIPETGRSVRKSIEFRLAKKMAAISIENK